MFCTGKFNTVYQRSNIKAWPDKIGRLLTDSQLLFEKGFNANVVVVIAWIVRDRRLFALWILQGKKVLSISQH